MAVSVLERFGTRATCACLDTNIGSGLNSAKLISNAKECEHMNVDRHHTKTMNNNHTRRALHSTCKSIGLSSAGQI